MLRHSANYIFWYKIPESWFLPTVNEILDSIQWTTWWSIEERRDHLPWPLRFQLLLTLWSCEFSPSINTGLKCFKDAGRRRLKAIVIKSQYIKCTHSFEILTWHVLFQLPVVMGFCLPNFDEIKQHLQTAYCRVSNSMMVYFENKYKSRWVDKLSL